jgi:hypothetical protein
MRRWIVKMTKKGLVAVGMENLSKKLPVVKHYVPDFKRSVDHFCSKFYGATSER